MKRPHRTNSNRRERPAGPRLWSSIEELSGDPAFQAWVDAEYPAAAEFAPTARRQFLKLMGASFALAGLTGCEKSPFVAALPYVDQPENETIGVPRYYATAVTFDGYAQPVIATTYSGRPTKLDGNPDHPVTQGRSDVFMQAAVLGLYDPDRAQAPTRHGEPVTWKDVAARYRHLRGDWSSDQGEGLRLLIGPTSLADPAAPARCSAASNSRRRGFICTRPRARRRARKLDGSRLRPAARSALSCSSDCDVVVSFDDDFLGPGPNQVRNARGWAASRRRSSGQPGHPSVRRRKRPGGDRRGGRREADRRCLAHGGSRGGACQQARHQRRGDRRSDAGRARLDRRRRQGLRRAEARALVTSGPFGDVGTAIWVARINDALKSAGPEILPTDDRSKRCGLA